ncbi:GerAB/ArcD/ProY family transporter [Peribacillus frigoritolerans]|nr:GerAB/ArcD/ProY family transporter [Peribacillus frigoritolerans]
MKSLLDERHLVSSFYVFFLIYTNIIGIGIMSFQRDITKDAGYDAWISIIFIKYKHSYTSLDDLSYSWNC